MVRVGVYVVHSYDGTRILCDLLSDEYDVGLIDAGDVKVGLGDFDVVVFPGGHEHVFKCFLSSRFREQLRRFVGDGGGYLGVCGGALVGGFLGFGGCKMGYLRLTPYATYYSLVGWDKARRELTICWSERNIFGRAGKQKIRWASSPYIIDAGNLNIDAFYEESVFLLPLRKKGAIASGYYKRGKVVLFCPHPELPCKNIDNSTLILDAIKWLTNQK